MEQEEIQKQKKVAEPSSLLFPNLQLTVPRVACLSKEIELDQLEKSQLPSQFASADLNTLRSLLELPDQKNQRMIKKVLEDTTIEQFAGLLGVLDHLGMNDLSNEVEKQLATLSKRRAFLAPLAKNSKLFEPLSQKFCNKAVKLSCMNVPQPIVERLIERNVEKYDPPSNPYKGETPSDLIVCILDNHLIIKNKNNKVLFEYFGAKPNYVSNGSQNLFAIYECGSIKFACQYQNKVVQAKRINEKKFGTLRKLGFNPEEDTMLICYFQHAIVLYNCANLENIDQAVLMENENLNITSGWSSGGKAVVAHQKAYAISYDLTPWDVTLHDKFIAQTFFRHINEQEQLVKPLDIFKAYGLLNRLKNEKLKKLLLALDLPEAH